MKWKAYDAAWLAELVKDQHPDRMRVWKNLLSITKYAEESRAYYYFVDPINESEKNAKWQFKENLIIRDKRLGDIILDILEDDRVGGAEFLKFVR